MSKKDSYSGGSTLIHSGSNWFSRPTSPKPEKIFAREKAEDANRKWLDQTSPSRTRQLEMDRASKIAKCRDKLVEVTIVSEQIVKVKEFIVMQLNANCEQVLPKTVASQQKHLSVWATRTKRRPIGVELEHPSTVNLWVLSMNVPSPLPPGVSVSKKVWKGIGWQDKVPDPAKKGRDGANSNLKPFEVFNTRPITRLGVQSIDDARAILDHLFL